MKDWENDVLTVGFLGFGEMGSAIAAGIGQAIGEARDRVRFLAWAPHAEPLRRRAEQTGAEVAASARELCEKSDAVILAMKPDQCAAAVTPVRDLLRGKPVISIVNGWTLAMFEELLGDGARVQCVMTNTPAKVGRGAFLFAEENTLRPEERARITELFSLAGAVIELPEKKIPAATSITGCGPAFLYMVIEALGDAGVKNGLKRQAAYELAARTMLGAAEMVLRGEGHPGALKDAVCSPGGTTIRGVAALEEAGMRSAFIKAVDATLGK